jgi:mRNA-degrading endonuclease RelE of RelBE toxin-antitoxin system
MFNLIDRISLLGVTPTQDARERNRITIMNLFFGFCSLVALIFIAYLDIRLQQLLFSFTAVIFLSILPLHHYGHYRTALSLGVLSTGGAVSLMSVFQPYHNGFYLYFFTTPLMILSFYSMRRKIVLFSMITFYGLLNIATYIYHTYTEVSIYESDSLIFPINIVTTILIIVLLSYNFWRTNIAYAKHTEIQNTILEEKIVENEKLLSDLNDKVKNNLQNMSILSEADVLLGQKHSREGLLQLYRSRIKTMDICFQIVYEKHIPQNQWLMHLFESYCAFVQQTAKSKIAFTTSFEKQHNKIQRKRFDGIALLLNELCFQIMQPFSKDLRIYNIHIALNAESEPRNTIIVTIEIHNMDALPVLNPLIYQLAAVQRVKLSTNLSSPDLLTIKLEILC